MFCKNGGVDEKCGQCSKKFHIDCARDHGSLRLKKEKGGIISSGKTKYRWNCPNCGKSSSGKF